MSTSDKKSTTARNGVRKDTRAGAYHHGNLRAALMTAGLELLEKGGQADFSLREAARAVGVTVNASYRHFRNKDALLAAIAAEGFRRFAAALMAGGAQADTPVARMLGAGRAYVDFARHNPALFRLMFGRFGITGHGEELLLAAHGANEVLRHGVAALMEKDPGAPEVALAVLKAWSLAHGLSHLVMDGQIDDRAPGFAQLVDSILGSYRP